MLEIGAGAGRNTLRYRGYERIVLMDYALTQLQQAQQRLESPTGLSMFRRCVPYAVCGRAVRRGYDDSRAASLSEIHSALAEIQRVMQYQSVFIWNLPIKEI